MESSELERCPICRAERSHAGRGLAGGQRINIVTFRCGLVIANPNTVIQDCPEAAVYGWSRALDDAEVAKYGSADRLEATAIIRRAEELVGMVGRDREALIAEAARLIWRGEVLDGIVEGKHNPRECPMLDNARDWCGWPCPDCDPVMDRTMPAMLREGYRRRAAAETHMEFELASAIVRLLELLRGRGHGD